MKTKKRKGVLTPKSKKNEEAASPKYCFPMLQWHELASLRISTSHHLLTLKKSSEDNESEQESDEEVSESTEHHPLTLNNCADNESKEESVDEGSESTSHHLPTLKNSSDNVSEENVDEGTELTQSCSLGIVSSSVDNNDYSNESVNEEPREIESNYQLEDCNQNHLSSPIGEEAENYVNEPTAKSRVARLQSKESVCNENVDKSLDKYMENSVEMKRNIDDILKSLDANEVTKQTESEENYTDYDRQQLYYFDHGVNGKGRVSRSRILCANANSGQLYKSVENGPLPSALVDDVNKGTKFDHLYRSAQFVSVEKPLIVNCPDRDQVRRRSARLHWKQIFENTKNEIDVDDTVEDPTGAVKLKRLSKSLGNHGQKAKKRKSLVSQGMESDNENELYKSVENGPSPSALVDNDKGTKFDHLYHSAQFVSVEKPLIVNFPDRDKVRRSSARLHTKQIFENTENVIDVDDKVEDPTGAVKLKRRSKSVGNHGQKAKKRKSLVSQGMESDNDNELYKSVENGPSPSALVDNVNKGRKFDHLYRSAQFVSVEKPLIANCSDRDKVRRRSSRLHGKQIFENKKVIDMDDKVEDPTSAVKLKRLSKSLGNIGEDPTGAVKLKRSSKCLGNNGKKAKKRKSLVSQGMETCDSSESIGLMTPRENIEELPGEKTLDLVNLSSGARIPTYDGILAPDDKSTSSSCPSGKRHRNMPCRKCPGCTRPDCKSCVFCLDMAKYGGPQVQKQKCKFRKCESRVLGTCQECLT